MDEEIEKKLARIEDYIESAKWDLHYAIDEIGEIYSLLENEDDKRIKDIDNLRRELKRDGLCSNKLEEFLDNYMRFYNK